MRDWQRDQWSSFAESIAKINERLTSPPNLSIITPFFSKETYVFSPPSCRPFPPHQCPGLLLAPLVLKEGAFLAHPLRQHAFLQRKDHIRSKDHHRPHDYTHHRHHPRHSLRHFWWIPGMLSGEMYRVRDLYRCCCHAGYRLGSSHKRTLDRQRTRLFQDR